MLYSEGREERSHLAGLVAIAASAFVLPRFPNTGIRRSGLRSAKPSPGLIPILRTADRPSQLRLPINQKKASKQQEA